VNRKWGRLNPYIQDSFESHFSFPSKTNMPPKPPRSNRTHLKTPFDPHPYQGRTYERSSDVKMECIGFQERSTRFPGRIHKNRVQFSTGHLLDVFGRTREHIRKVPSKWRLGRKAPRRPLSPTDAQEQIACHFIG
jgi:hypothetical protein